MILMTGIVMAILIARIDLTVSKKLQPSLYRPVAITDRKTGHAVPKSRLPRMAYNLGPWLEDSTGHTVIFSVIVGSLLTMIFPDGVGPAGFIGGVGASLFSAPVYKARKAARAIAARRKAV